MDMMFYSACVHVCLACILISTHRQVFIYMWTYIMCDFANVNVQCYNYSTTQCIHHIKGY